MMDIKDKIAEIEKGCGLEGMNNFCGDLDGWLCESCYAKKQGLIEGYLIAIEEIKELLEEDITHPTGNFHLLVHGFIKLRKQQVGA